MTSRSALFGINCYLASVGALFVAFWFNLPNPWWALLTVFFTSQPGHEGGVWAKAAFRVGGTVLGLIAALIALPNLVNEPEILIGCLAAWLGVCLSISLLDRTPRSYMPMLAGYTAVLISFPVIDSPGNIFDTAIARTEEILIGVVCASVAHGVIFPRRVHDIVADKVDASLADAASWSMSALSSDIESKLKHARYAAAIVDLAIVATTLAYEAPYARNQVRLVRALSEKLAAILPLVDAVMDRILLLEAHARFDQEIRDVMAKLEHCLVLRNAPDQEWQSIFSTCDALIAKEASSEWDGLERCGLLSRIKTLAETWRDCHLLADMFHHPWKLPSPHIKAIVRTAQAFRLYSDPALAVWSGATASLAVLITGYLSILIKWNPGTLAIGITAVFSCLFAAIDDPTPILKKSLLWTMIGIPIGFIYVFGILPVVDGFFELAMGFFPLLFMAGYWMASPKTLIPGLLLVVTTTSVIGLQASYVGDFESFWNLAIASVIGELVVLATIQSVRVIATATVADRVVRRGWRELANLASDGDRQYRSFAMLMLDRVGLLIIKAAPHSLGALNGLRDLRLGVNLTELMAASDKFSRRDQMTLRAFRKRLARLIKRRIAGCGERADQLLLDSELDDLRLAAISLDNGADRTRAITALTGIRHGLSQMEPSFVKVA